MSLAQALTPTLQASFRDIFASVLTPAFERALQNMLNNLGQTFTKGTRDYETVIRKEVHQLTNQVRSQCQFFPVSLIMKKIIDTPGVQIKYPSSGTASILFHSFQEPYLSLSWTLEGPYSLAVACFRNLKDTKTLCVAPGAYVPEHTVKNN